MTCIPACGGIPCLTISVTADRDGQPVLVVTGDLDVATRESLRLLLDGLLEAGSPQTVTLDLAGVSFADCASLSVLVRTQQRLADRGGRLITTGARPVVRRIIRLTGLTEYLGVIR